LTPTPPPPSECVLTPHQRRGGTHSPGGEGGGGSIFWKTPDIGLASYSIISLRAWPSPDHIQLLLSVGTQLGQPTEKVLCGLTGWILRVHCTTLRGVYESCVLFNSRDSCYRLTQLKQLWKRIFVTSSHEVFWTVKDNCTGNPYEQFGHLYTAYHWTVRAPIQHIIEQLGTRDSPTASEVWSGLKLCPPAQGNYTHWDLLNLFFPTVYEKYCDF
jgi:hypothetical protein